MSGASRLRWGSPRMRQPATCRTVSVDAAPPRLPRSRRGAARPGVLGGLGSAGARHARGAARLGARRRPWGSGRDLASARPCAGPARGSAVDERAASLRRAGHERDPVRRRPQSPRDREPERRRPARPCGRELPARGSRDRDAAGDGLPEVPDAGGGDDDRLRGGRARARLGAAGGHAAADVPAPPQGGERSRGAARPGLRGPPAARLAAAGAGRAGDGHRRRLHALDVLARRRRAPAHRDGRAPLHPPVLPDRTRDPADAGLEPWKASRSAVAAGSTGRRTATLRRRSACGWGTGSTGSTSRA